MKLHVLLTCMAGLLFFITSMAQSNLSSGFDPAEYEDLLDINQVAHKDSINPGLTAGKQHLYTMLFRSPELGLKNRWDLWLRDDLVAVISIRGTVQHAASWMANFYTAMVPASGEIRVNPQTIFTYKLANDPKATVHVGWTVSLAHIAPMMVEKLKSLVQEKQVRQLIVTGHSQGGALTFLTTSYLYYLSEAGQLPAKLTIKAYCSAAPKPGNIFYAYDFDFITRNGMGFNVVNAADWVPETPPTVQTFNDINPTNPFYNATTLLGKQKWPANWYLKSTYKKIRRSPDKTMRRYEKYFGHKIYTQVRKTLPDLQEPAYAGSSNFMRTGIPIVLVPDKEYFEKFPEDPNKVFIHHLFDPYRYLLHKYYGQAQPK
jgi:Lipase (class 3)